MVWTRPHVHMPTGAPALCWVASCNYFFKCCSLLRKCGILAFTEKTVITAIDSKSNVLPERWFDPTFIKFKLTFLNRMPDADMISGQNLVSLGQVVISIWNLYWKYIKNALKFSKTFCFYAHGKDAWFISVQKILADLFTNLNFQTSVRLNGLNQSSQLPQPGRCSLSFQSAGHGAIEASPWQRSSPSVKLLYFSVVLFHRGNATALLGSTMHTVSFSWFLSRLGWIINLEFCY